MKSAGKPVNTGYAGIFYFYYIIYCGLLIFCCLNVATIELKVLIQHLTFLFFQIF